MKRPYYIFNSGRLRRKDNTICFERYTDEETDLSGETQLLKDEYHTAMSEEEIIELKATEDVPDKDKRFLPVEDVEAFYAFCPVDFNSVFLNFLTRYTIPVHVFNYYGGYSGSYLPRMANHSGLTVVRQVEFYLRPAERMRLARAIVEAACYNILKNLEYYQYRGRDLQAETARIGELDKKIKNCSGIQQLMGIEGNIRELYYQCWSRILQHPDPVFRFTQRTKQPPKDPVNALISFGNSYLYSFLLTEILRTTLLPTISYLHEPSDRRFSLCLDISEIFKPLLVDRVIFKLVNHEIMKKGHFRIDEEKTYLNENGRKIFIRELDEKLKKTFIHPETKQEVSFRRLIRLELYKLIKHLEREKFYEGFRIPW